MKRLFSSKPGNLPGGWRSGALVGLIVGILLGWGYSAGVTDPGVSNRRVKRRFVFGGVVVGAAAGTLLRRISGSKSD